jgi:hypothetical protein
MVAVAVVALNKQVPPPVLMVDQAVEVGQD